eukprot:Hpha_TRINITY_DN16753_c1_g1::TRINITY_DN16753_c1_g1_i1::g.77662::m.77662
MQSTVTAAPPRRPQLDLSAPPQPGAATGRQDGRRQPPPPAAKRLRRDVVSPTVSKGFKRPRSRPPRDSEDLRASKQAAATPPPKKRRELETECDGVSEDELVVDSPLSLSFSPSRGMKEEISEDTGSESDEGGADEGGGTPPDFQLPSREDGAQAELRPGLNVSGIHVTVEDYLTLTPGSFLNDKVINVFLAMLNQRARLVCAGATGEPRIQYLTTHLWARLCQSPDLAVRWFKHRAFLDREWLFFPVHSGMHWTALVPHGLKRWLMKKAPQGAGPPSRIKKPQPKSTRRQEVEVFEVSDDSDVDTGVDEAVAAAVEAEGPPDVELEARLIDLTPDGTTDTFVLSFDSLGYSHRTKFKRLSRFICRRWVHELREAGYATTGINPERLAVEMVREIPVHAVRAPSQENGHDCGVFLLHYADLLGDPALLSAISKGGRRWATRGVRKWFGSDKQAKLTIGRKRPYIATQLLWARGIQAERGVVHVQELVTNPENSFMTQEETRASWQNTTALVARMEALEEEEWETSSCMTWSGDSDGKQEHEETYITSSEEDPEKKLEHERFLNQFKPGNVTVPPPKKKRKKKPKKGAAGPTAFQEGGEGSPPPPSPDPLERRSPRDAAISVDESPSPPPDTAMLGQKTVTPWLPAAPRKKKLKKASTLSESLSPTRDGGGRELVAGPEVAEGRSSRDAPISVEPSSHPETFGRTAKSWQDAFNSAPRRKDSPPSKPKPRPKRKEEKPGTSSLTAIGFVSPAPPTRPPPASSAPKPRATDGLALEFAPASEVPAPAPAPAPTRA